MHSSSWSARPIPCSRSVIGTTSQEAKRGSTREPSRGRYCAHSAFGALHSPECRLRSQQMHCSSPKRSPDTERSDETEPHIYFRGVAFRHASRCLSKPSARFARLLVTAVPAHHTSIVVGLEVRVPFLLTQAGRAGATITAGLKSRRGRLK